VDTNNNHSIKLKGFVFYANPFLFEGKRGKGAKVQRFKG